MNQVLLDLNSGSIFIEEVPVPKPHRGIVVKNYYSVISAGTESSLINLAQKSKLAMAQERPDLVKKVIDKAKTDGILSAYHQAMSRLSKPEPLGYSCAGIVKDTDIAEFSVGERVACAGAGYACHAEYVSVPKNLCVKIPDNVSLRDASFTTIGAIAMQGIRNAEVTVGEKIAVIGLGLIGLITIQIAKAAGCKVFGIDLDPKKIKLARELGADVTSTYQNLHEKMLAFSSFGADKVIITAATASNGPVETAGDLVRTGGKIIVVGAVGMNIPRDKYYNKEAELVVSRSYGPGRYDRNFEEGGIDYPIYVRWTEKRNMEAFLDLLSDNKINLDKIVTHVFDIQNALAAYELINTRKEPFLGIVLTYETKTSQQIPGFNLHTIQLNQHSEKVRKSSKTPPIRTIGCIGAGIHATSTLFPNLVKLPVRLKGIATATGLSASTVGKKFGFEYCTTDYQQILKDQDIDAVIITTRNDLHAKITIEALKAGKDVFVEKPPATTLEQLNEITEEWKNGNNQVFVGFNRRYSPLARQLLQYYSGRKNPMIINYRINSGLIPHDHWTHDEIQGGNMLISECCHFVDFLLFATESKPSKISVHSIKDNPDARAFDNFQIVIKFFDGSLGSIIYTTLGNEAVPKERVEIFSSNSVGVINNFLNIKFFSDNKSFKKSYWISQNKGFFNELEAFIIKRESNILTSIQTMHVIFEVEKILLGGDVK